MSNIPTASNELIAEFLKTELYKSERLSKSIRSQKEGYLKVFVRNYKVQKISFLSSTCESSQMDLLDFTGLEGNEEPSFERELIPKQAYLRFCYTLSTLVLYIGEPIEYGYLLFDFEFYKHRKNDEWHPAVKLKIEEEIHFKY